MTEKLDIKQTPAYRARRGRYDVIEIPETRYLMVDGHGDPNTAPAFTEATEALYPVAYAVKFASKQAGRDYVVPPLEGLWWADDMAAFTSARDKAQWNWTLMLSVPEWITAEDVGTAIATVRAKTVRAKTVRAKKKAPARLAEVRFAALTEGLCVQTLHIGPYEAESEVLARMHDEFIPDRGLALSGTHHEIYLSDPRRVTPERLRTILRQPVRAANGA